MSRYLLTALSPVVLLVASLLVPSVAAQTAPPKAVDDIKVDPWNSVPLHGPAYKDVKSGPAPRRDLSGIWDATGDRTKIPPAGIQPTGAFEHRAVSPDNDSPAGGEPDERHIANPLPYTALGESSLEANKPTSLGLRSVPATKGNDPVDACNPPGFPRADLNEFRNFEILQADNHVAIMYQTSRTWRTIWTDGRELPKDPEPRFNGYSVGKWVDDYTFVVQTVGMREDTWLDSAGRPHSSDLKVEERYHRVDQDHLELSVTIDDPKMYTKPWVALNKFPVRRQPRDFDIRELFCAPADFADYNTNVGDPVDEPANK